MTVWIESFLFQVVKVLVSLLPRRWSLRFGRAFGSFIYHVDSRHRRLALNNLQTAFGQNLSQDEIQSVALASFQHFGRIMADIFKLFRLSPDEREGLVSVEGWEILTKALEQGRGVLAFSAHIGNWELGSLILSKAAKLNVIARALDNKTVERELLQFRNSLGAGVIYKQDAARKVLRALRNNEIVAILIDQNVLRSQAVFVDFFGRPAATTPALGDFYLRTRASLVPVFCLMDSSGKYRVKILPPPEITLDGDIEKDVLKITGICTKIIESEIRDDPENWLWFHDRWRSRPKEEHDSQNDQNP